MGRKPKNKNQQKKHPSKEKRREKGRKNPKFNQSFDLLMRQQLSAFNLDFKEITGDGNCLFRAISDQTSGTEDLHEEYRALAIGFMKSHKEDFAPFIEDDESFDDYIKRISKTGVWGGNLELQALSQALEVNIKIHILGSPVWEIVNWPSAKYIHLSYHEESHYNSVRVRGDVNDGVPQEIPELNQVVESSEESKNRIFDLLAQYFVDTFGEGVFEKVCWALKRIYKEVPGFDRIFVDYQRIVDETEDYKEEKKNEEEKEVKNEKNEKKNLKEEKKKPAKLPNNKDKCWCGSGKIYKKCCKSHDHLRETEEEKVVTKVNSLQI